MAAELEVSVVGANPAFLLGKSQKIAQGIRQGLQRAGAIVFRQVQTHLHAAPGYSATDLHVRTGKLAQSLNVSPVSGEGLAQEIRVGFRRGPAGKYAPVHEFGATINVPEIVPVRRKALRWVTKDGAVVFARRARAHTVTIPARAPLSRGLGESRAAVREAIDSAVSRAVGNA